MPPIGIAPMTELPTNPHPFAPQHFALSNYWIKLLAGSTMVIDHIGHIFFPEDPIWRLIGRLSFPLFCWLLVQGEDHTRNVWRYASRLLLLAVLSQPLYQWTYSLNGSDLNILFTLAIGLLCLRGSREFPAFELPIWLVGALLATLFNSNYIAYGIAMIGLIRHFRPTVSWWAGWLLLHGFDFALSHSVTQLFALPAPLIFYLSNGKQGDRARWFYLFYPGHLLLLGLINWYLARSAVG